MLLENRTHLICALAVHFGLLIIKAEIDQFKEGLLKGMQLLVELQKHPELFAPVFTCAGEKPLTAGKPDEVSLGEVLSFFTGATRIPIGGFDCKASLIFSYYHLCITISITNPIPQQ